MIYHLHRDTYVPDETPFAVQQLRSDAPVYFHDACKHACTASPACEPGVCARAARPLYRAADISNHIAAHAASEIDGEPHAPARGICTAVAIVAALGLLVFGGPVVWHLIARVFA